MNEIKKFYVPTLRTYNNDMSKRWRIEYYSQIADARGDKRVIIYGNINRGKTVQERYDRAELIINSINLTPIIIRDKEYTNFLFDTIDRKSIVWKAKTTQIYKSIAITFTDYLVANSIMLIKVTDKHIHDYLIYLKTVLNKTPSSIAKYRDFLYALYQHAIEYGYTKHNPVIKIDRIKRSPTS